MSEMTVEQALSESDKWVCAVTNMAIAMKVLAAEVRRLRDDLSDEQERHAILQSRCFEGYPSVSDGIFDAVKERDKEIAELRSIISGALVEDVIQYFPAEWIARAEKALGGNECPIK